MQISTKYKVGEQVLFFTDDNKKLDDIQRGIIMEIRAFILRDASVQISYVILTQSNNKDYNFIVDKKDVYKSYLDIMEEASALYQKRSKNSIQKAYETLGRELGLL